MLVGEACCARCRYLLCWGDLTAARASAEEGIRLARQSGVPALEILHDVLLAIVEVVAGDWAAALRRTFDDLGLAQRVGLARVEPCARPSGLVSSVVGASTRPPTGSARHDGCSGDGPRPTVTCLRMWISLRA